MKHLLPPTVVAVLILLGEASGHASAQCIDWTPGYNVAGIDGSVYALAAFDDGTGGGSELYVGGQFQTAGGVLASNVAKWNGTGWAPVGAGRPGPVRSFCVWDDGGGPALYAGLNRPEAYVPPSGSLTTIAKWNGNSWVGLPGGIDLGFGAVKTMVVHDAGSGPALYVGGLFHPNSPDWPSVRSIARFDGTSWSPVGNGFYNAGDGVECLASFDDGSGARLYAGGSNLRTVPGSAYGPIARFDGTQWDLAFAGLSASFSHVRAFARFGPGAGTLYAGGEYLLGLSSNPLVRLAGGVWTPVGGEIVGRIDSLAPWTSPQGDLLYAAGVLYQAGSASVRGVASFDGSGWQAVGSGTSPGMGPLATYDAGSGPELFAGGTVSLPGGPDAVGIARFDGGAWNALGPGVDQAPAPLSSTALVSHDDGQGSALYTGSETGVLERVGDHWMPVGPSLGQPIFALLSHDDGLHGRQLYAGGGAVSINGRSVARVLRWDGTTWIPLGTGLSFANPSWSPRLYDLVSFDDGSGPRLVAGGDFDQADGQVAPFAAAWDGQAWSPLSTGLNHIVLDLEVYDDGAGPALFAGGLFAVPGGSNGIARWNGNVWTGAGPGAPPAQALRVHDDGSGPRLYASRRTGVPGWGAGIDAWDGATWNVVTSGTSPSCFASYDDGAGGGPALVAGGNFTAIGGVSASGIASFSGGQWQALNGGVRPASVRRLAVHDDGAGAALFAQGDFSIAGPFAAHRLARYGPTGASGCVPRTGSVSCAGDGGGAACPCSNTGSVGRGCGNSANAGGAELVAEGQAHLGCDSVTLRASGMTFGGTVLFFQGTQSVALGAGAPFGDGVRCVSGAQIRLAIRAASSGAASFGRAVAGDPSVSSAGQLASGPVTRHYQAWYRDAPVFCTSSTFNLTNAVRILWAP